VSARPDLGVGIGWRHEIDLTVEQLPVDWVEFVAEDVSPNALPESLEILLRDGKPALPHAVSLSLGGAEPLVGQQVEHLARVAELAGAPLVSDHVAFTRAGGLNAGHLLPVPRTRAALDVLTANVRSAQSELPVPLALENIAALVEWPHAEYAEGEFLRELVERTGCWLIVDVANLYANAHNTGTNPIRFLDAVPWERIAYVHIGGGVWRDGVYHDTHAHPVLPEVLDLLTDLCQRTRPPGVLLERDDRFPSDDELAGELDAIRGAMR
jgi:uncharacterized protein (UPF0276 family)